MIKDGLRSIKEHEKGDKRAGGITGFVICRRLLTPEDYQNELDKRHREEHALSLKANGKKIPSDTYWAHRYSTLQIEFVWEVLKVGLQMYPLSARAVMKYTEIVGVR